MSRAYKFHNSEGLYFISFATVGWIDVFTRRIYKEILIESIKYCQKNKGLGLYAWCIMSNHVHMIVKAKDGYVLSDIIRDLKKYTSKEIIKAIEDNIQESRKEWMPVEEGIVESPEQYLYSSAKNFNEEKGLLNLEVL